MSEGESAGACRDFDDVLRFLRSLADPCEPPVGVGAFDVLFASEREVCVWYTPAREGHEPREVGIPTALLADAWAALATGRELDEAALAEIGGNAAYGRWLLAVLAQAPGVRVDGERLALRLEDGTSPSS